MKLLLIVAAVAVVIVAGIGIKLRDSATTVVRIERDYPTDIPQPSILPTPTDSPIKSILLEVPFASQSPFGEWSDKRQQDGCEEASVILAYCAVNSDECPVTNGKIDKQWMKDKLIDIYNFQIGKWGLGIDTSAKDTGERLLAGYFNYSKYKVLSVENGEDIIQELMAGNVVIVPTNGKLLFNPNFTNGGPERHMLVVRGYDVERKQFITQDPGTRQGENYRYDEDLFFKAIRDYETGDHEPIVGVNKRMIVIELLGSTNI